MLDLDLVTILAEIFNFLIMAVVLYFLLFKPTVKRIEKHTREKEALLSDAKEKQQQADQRLAEIENRLANIDQEIEERLEIAYQHAEQKNQSLLEATQKEAARILKEANIEAEKRQKQELSALQEDLVETILNISRQILGKSTPEVIHDNLIEELTSEIWDLGKNDMRQVRSIRDSLAERTPTILITSSKELTSDQQRNLIRTFSALADRNINMDIDIDPDLIAGIRVRMGDLVVENTLGMELESLKSDVVDMLEESVYVD